MFLNSKLCIITLFCFFPQFLMLIQYEKVIRLRKQNNSCRSHHRMSSISMTVNIKRIRTGCDVTACFILISVVFVYLFIISSFCVQQKLKIRTKCVQIAFPFGVVSPSFFILDIYFFRALQVIWCCIEELARYRQTECLFIELCLALLVFGFFAFCVSVTRACI